VPPELLSPLSPVSSSSSSRFVLALQLLAKRRLQHLAVVVLRRRVDEAVLARPLEARDVREAERVELAGVDRGAVAGDEGDDGLAPARVAAADDRDLAHPRMAQQHFLALARIDVRAAADDEILRAVLQRQEA